MVYGEDLNIGVTSRSEVTKSIYAWFHRSLLILILSMATKSLESLLNPTNPYYYH